MAVEAVKSVAFASLLGVLVLVFALQEGSVWSDQIPTNFDEHTVEVAGEDSFAASTSFSSAFGVDSEVTEAFSSAVFWWCDVYQQNP